MTSICVVTMDRPATLRATLDAVEEHAVDPYEVIVVDNGSQDPAAVAYLDQIERRWKVVRNPTNVGLSVATNQGLQAANYPVLVHLDDDALITQPGWNQTVARFLDVHPEVGIVAPDRGNIGVIHHPGYTEVRWFLGMAWAIRAEVFDEIGGYDPQLIHQQECDLCLRVRMLGYRAAQCPEWSGAAVVHNDSAPQSALSKARENMGTVQFHTKWCQYFLGRAWSYGTTPRYLMQHFPIDLDFFARLGGPGLNDGIERLVVDGHNYWVHRDIRPDNAFMDPHGSTAYQEFADQIAAEWKELTGEDYAGYDWGRLPFALPHG